MLNKIKNWSKTPAMPYILAILTFGLTVFVLYSIIASHIHEMDLKIEKARVQRREECRDACSALNMRVVECSPRVWTCYNPRTERIEVVRGPRY